ncbi:GntR family transcriptional regulator [Tsukamurella asaccharolytica]|uniref:GntR family transcriptional regulator n=1 Tax=Tsukamurella asaccharolytica TaxID=2592067 RepID=A0A5C5R5K8_9ACTN|nr:GntR family transcriptional regulator [Tsukamurella asaccharolytica]TWS18300.1 GntR family transcriptional regulator [Tsukamurella asaccharolytica]
MPATERPIRADSARIVADVLRQAIHDGTYRGSLPGEDDLGVQFSVSRGTVREALSILRDEGWIRRGPRVGTEVIARTFDHGLDSLRGLRETLSLHGEVRNRVRTATRLVPPPIVAEKLGIPRREEAVYLERLRYLDDEPISLDLTYLVSDVGDLLLEQDLENEDVFPLIEAVTGHRLGTSDYCLTAAAADPHTAANLEIATGSPLLLYERLTHLECGRPVDLEYIRIRSDRITLRGTLHRD